MHAQWGEERRLHQRVHGLAEPLLDHELQQVDALSGVPIPSARHVMKAHPAVGFHRGEVRETAGVRKQHARSNSRPERIMYDERGLLAVRCITVERLRHLAHDREIEIEATLPHELHDVRAEHRFRDRSRPRRRRALHREVGA